MSIDASGRYERTLPVCGIGRVVLISSRRFLTSVDDSSFRKVAVWLSFTCCGCRDELKGVRYGQNSG